MALRKYARKIVFAAAGTVDYKFTDKSQTYLGETVEEIFNEIYINNQSNFDLYYSIEADTTDSITVNDAATEGVTKVERKAAINQQVVEITRVRIRLEGSGVAYLILHNNPRPYQT
jgi:hypothetical protein